MRSIRCSSRRSFPEGFTLLETLVAVALFAALTGAFWLLAGGVFRAAAVAVDEALSASAALAVDGAIRAAVARVRPPFWLLPSMMGEGNRVPMVDGKPGAWLEIAADKEGIAVTLPEGREMIIGALDAEVERLPGGGGFVVRYRCRGRRYETRAAFGSTSAPEVAP